MIRSVVGVQVVSGPRLLGSPSVEPKNDLGSITLAPGESKLIKFEGKAPEWNQSLFGEKVFLTTGGPTTRRDARIHIYGQLLYVDGNKTQRRTAFRRELRPEVQRFYRLSDEPDLDYAD